MLSLSLLDLQIFILKKVDLLQCKIQDISYLIKRLLQIELVIIIGKPK